jgi:DNA mismatch endonuclease, patch repair protein
MDIFDLNADPSKLRSQIEEDGPSPARSALMARVGPKDTQPELVVRSLVHALGYRFRLQRQDLPGTPDIVLPRLGKVIFVHGCFWHRHLGCKKASMPKTRVDFWMDKFTSNVERDARKERELRLRGWDVAIVWECETRNHETLTHRLANWLSQSSAHKA